MEKKTYLGKTITSQHECAYDAVNRLFVIDGMKFTPEFFRMMYNPTLDGEIIEIKHTDSGACTFTFVHECAPNTFRSDDEIQTEATKLKRLMYVVPFDIVSFMMGARWIRDGKH